MAHEYATLAELRESRRITSATDTTDDDALTRALTRASRAIDDRCGRRFWLDVAAGARVLNPAGLTVPTGDGERLLVADIGSATDLTVELGRASSWTDVTSSIETEPLDALDHSPPRPYTSLLYVGGCWRSGTSGRVRVTARWGWPEVPDSVAEATLLLANRRFMRRNSPEGVAGWADQGAVRVSRFDPDIEDLLAPYVLAGIA